MSLGALEEEIFIISKNGDLHKDRHKDRHKDIKTDRHERFIELLRN